MTAKNRTTLKTQFQTGDTPTGSDFDDLIDSTLNVADTTAQTINSDVNINGQLTVSQLTVGDIQATVASFQYMESQQTLYLGLLRQDAVSSAAATGASAASALPVSAYCTRVSTVIASANGVRLLALSNNNQGFSQFIFNDTNENLNIYPASGGSINNLSANAPYVASASTKVEIFHARLSNTIRYFTK
jgi:hypothetical protein